MVILATKPCVCERVNNETTTAVECEKRVNERRTTKCVSYAVVLVSTRTVRQGRARKMYQTARRYDRYTHHQSWYRRNNMCPGDGRVLISKVRERECERAVFTLYGVYTDRVRETKWQRRTETETLY